MMLSKRKMGYMAALKDFGVEINNEWMVDGDFTLKGGEFGCSRLLSLMNKPDVIFAANDMMAVGCYRAAQSRGRKIPEDISVVGFDHITLSNFIYPKLTTVHVPISELGKSAAKLLLNRMSKKEEQLPQHIKISTGLIIGRFSKN